EAYYTIAFANYPVEEHYYLGNQEPHTDKPAAPAKGRHKPAAPARGPDRDTATGRKRRTREWSGPFAARARRTPRNETCPPSGAAPGSARGGHRPPWTASENAATPVPPCPAISFRGVT